MARGRRISQRRPGLKKVSPTKGDSEWEIEDLGEEAQASTVILEGIKKVGLPRRKDGETKPQGLSLGVKFAFVISLVSALLCGSTGVFIYLQVKESLISEIDCTGATVVRSIASIAEEYYTNYFPLIQRSQKLQEEYEKLYQKAAKTRDPKVYNTYKEKIQKLQEQKKELQAKKKKLKTTFSQYLERVVAFYVEKEAIFSEKILNVSCCVNSSVIPSIQAGVCKASDIIGSHARCYEEEIGGYLYETGIQIFKGIIETKSGKRSRVRGYQLPVIKNKLSALVMISEQEIVNTTGKIWMGILITTGIAISLGILISFLLAKHVTKPLEQLVYDIEVVSTGNLSHTTLITSRDEIGILAHAFNVMTKNLRNAHKAELERQAREHELEIAKEIQSNLLPSEISQIPGYDIATYYNPSKEVGGDYYDLIPIGENYLGFVVADVSGKSIPGAMVMTMTRSLIRMEALRNLSPAKIFYEVNYILAQDIRKGMFVTAMYALLDISQAKLLISSAGHNPAVIWRQQGKIELVNLKGMALGLTKGAIFEKQVKEIECPLYSGDRIVFYTDGVPEAMSPKNEEFGEERFYQLVSQHANKTSEEFIQIIVKALETWRKKCPQSDDITLLTLKKV